MLREIRPLLIVLLTACFPLHAAVGTTTVCTWKDDLAAAFTLGADDGCGSQLDNMVPELTKRGFVATFWINPGKSYFTARLAEWASAARAGNDFANHTMNHNGAADSVSADSEIGGCARWIWAHNPAQGKLQLFMQGGGTTWGISSQQEIDLLNKYKLYPHWDEAGRGDGIHEGAYADHDAATLKSYLDNAIRDGDWHFTIFHGVGGDWIPQNVPALVELLDYMVTKKSTVWFPTCTQAHKYKEERVTAHVAVLEATSSLIRVNLTSDMDTALYAYPLSLKTSAPAGWDSCRVTQGSSGAVFAVAAGSVLYYAVPGKGEISLTNNASTSVVPRLKDSVGASAGAGACVTARVHGSSVVVQYRVTGAGRASSRLCNLQGALIGAL